METDSRLYCENTKLTPKHYKKISNKHSDQLRQNEKTNCSNFDIVPSSYITQAFQNTDYCNKFFELYYFRITTAIT